MDLLGVRKVKNKKTMPEGEPKNEEELNDPSVPKTGEIPVIDLERELDKLKKEYNDLLSVARRDKKQQSRFKFIKNFIDDIESRDQ